MDRRRGSAKLPKRCSCTSPITRSGSILMRACTASAPSRGGADAAIVAAARPTNQRFRFMVSAPSTECLGAEDPSSFANHDELVGLDAGDLLGGAARPPDRQVGGRRDAQSEVQAAIVGGVEARLRRDLLRLR